MGSNTASSHIRQWLPGDMGFTSTQVVLSSSPSSLATDDDFRVSRRSEVFVVVAHFEGFEGGGDWYCILTSKGSFGWAWSGLFDVQNHHLLVPAKDVGSSSEYSICS